MVSNHLSHSFHFPDVCFALQSFFIYLLRHNWLKEEKKCKTGLPEWSQPELKVFASSWRYELFWSLFQSFLKIHWQRKLSCTDSLPKCLQQMRAGPVANSGSQSSTHVDGRNPCNWAMACCLPGCTLAGSWEPQPRPSKTQLCCPKQQL